MAVIRELCVKFATENLTWGYGRNYIDRKFNFSGLIDTAIAALDLEFNLSPVPTVDFTTLRGRHITATYGKTPRIDGVKLDYDAWKLFGGTHLNSEPGSRILTITHGRLKRVLDFNTLSITDSVEP